MRLEAAAYMARLPIEAGGPGSGCHGPNCGRPKGPTIPHSEYPLSKAQRNAEHKFRRQMASDVSGHIKAYKMTYGNTLNADNAKELSSDYRADRSTIAPAVHEPASWLVKQMFKQELAKPAPKGKANMVFFTAGGAGAGKTTGIESDAHLKSIMTKAQIVYDGTLRPASSAIQKIDQALAAGKHVVVAYVDREPLDAFKNGVLTRAARNGRTVMAGEFAAQHTSIRQSMHDVQARYANNPNFTFVAIDNNHGLGNAKVTTLDALPPRIQDRDMLHAQVLQILEQEHNAGRVSDKIYETTKGHSGKEIGI